MNKWKCWSVIHYGNVPILQLSSIVEYFNISVGPVWLSEMLYIKIIFKEVLIIFRGTRERKNALVLSNKLCTISQNWNPGFNVHFPLFLHRITIVYHYEFWFTLVVIIYFRRFTRLKIAVVFVFYYCKISTTANQILKFARPNNTSRLWTRPKRVELKMERGAKVCNLNPWTLNRTKNSLFICSKF